MSAQDGSTVDCDIAHRRFRFSEIYDRVYVVFVIPDIVNLIVETSCQTISSFIRVSQVFELFVYVEHFDLLII